MFDERAAFQRGLRTLYALVPYPSISPGRYEYELIDDPLAAGLSLGVHMLWPFRAAADEVCNLAIFLSEKQRTLSATAILERMLICTLSTQF